MPSDRADVPPSGSCRAGSTDDERRRLARESLPTDEVASALAEVLAILSDPTRLKMLVALSAQELGVCDLASVLGVSGSVVAEQLRPIRRAGMLSCRRAGNVAYYRLDNACVSGLLELGLGARQDPTARPVTEESDPTMRLAIVLSNTDAETVFNALRLANFAVKQGDQVKVFLLGKGVELDQIEDPKFDVRAQAQDLLDTGGTIMACGTCLKLRQSDGSELCPLSTMKDLYEMVSEADRILTF